MKTDRVHGPDHLQSLQEKFRNELSYCTNSSDERKHRVREAFRSASTPNESQVSIMRSSWSKMRAICLCHLLLCRALTSSQATAAVHSWFKCAVDALLSSVTNRSFVQFGTSSNRSISMAQSEKGRHERLETAEKFVRFVLRMSCSSGGPDICYTDYSTAADGLSLLASTVSDASMSVPTTRETIPSVHAVQNLLCTILTTPAPRGRASIVEEYLKIVGDGTGAVFSPNSVRKTATFLKFMFRLCIAFDHAVPHTTAEGADLLTTTRTTYEGSLASHLDSPSGPFATLRYISARASFFESEITASAGF